MKQMHDLRSRFLVLGALFAFPGVSLAASEAVPAYVLKVEGDGLANVRKKSGIIESAGARGKVLPGDRIVTDEHSAVHLLLNDGSVLLIGFGSELRLNEVTANEKTLSWNFELVDGVVRVLAESLPAEGKTARLRIDTPIASSLVRGTEFVVAHDGAKNISSLFVMEGAAQFGAKGCDKNNSCIESKQGETSSFEGAKKQASAARKYKVGELLALSAIDIKRMSVFREVKKLLAKVPMSGDDASLTKMVEESRSDLKEAQDRAIGRSRRVGEDMKESVRQGVFWSTLEAADAYAEVREVFSAKTNAGAENYVAQVMASKFRLGQAVRGAAYALVFAANKNEVEKEKWSALGAAGFTYRKNVDYTQVETAKKWRAAIEAALVEYGATLEFAEALQSDQNTEKCNSSSCRVARAIHEMEIVSEGMVNAYDHVVKIVARPGAIVTPYFSRIVPGNGCFKQKQTCVMKVCTGFANGKRCKVGDPVSVCTSRQAPIRCSKKL